MVTLRDGDYMKTLVGFIGRNASHGYSYDQIRLLLVNQGYSRAAVDRAIRIYEQTKPKPAPVQAVEPPKVEPVKIQPTPIEKKPGFFARLFGAGKKKEAEEQPIRVDVATGNYQ